MVTTVNEREGLVKVYWKDVAEKVREVEPQFARIVDELNPDKSFPLYLAYYPYGAVDADTISTLFPDQKGGYYRLTDPEAPKEVLEDFRYSIGNTPLSMVLEKQFEGFIDLSTRGITIPWLIYTPGKMCPYTRILPLNKKQRVYSPNGLFSSVAGARSVFMLPSIGSASNHINLQLDFNVQNQPPKNLYDHWNVFNEIIHSQVVGSDWKACVIYFPGIWIDKIHNDLGWGKLKQYLFTKAWEQFEYEITRSSYDMLFSIVQQNRNLKPNPYLTDTAKHLFATAISAVPGYAPALNDDAFPLEILQKAYVESYGLKKYLPTIMHPVYFNFEKNDLPIYYSLQNPATHVFSPKSREVSSTLFEMRELEHIMKIFTFEFSKKDSMCSDTFINKMLHTVKFNYFHSKLDRHGIIKSTLEIAKQDKRFSSEACKYKYSHAEFPNDAPFLRGCISINVNHTS